MSAAFKTRLFFFIALLLSGGCVSAQASNLGNETRAALSLYSAKEGIDTKRADARLFGLRLERHGNQTKASIFGTTDATIRTTDLACETQTSESYCQNLGTHSEVSYQREGVLYSAEFLTDALDAITEFLEKRGVIPESVSLFKIWHAAGGLQARIGFDASLVEVAFVCDPRDAVFCRPAESELRNEP